MKKTIIAAALICAASLTAGAQNLATGYFTDGYQHAYRLNPAAAPDKGFIGLGIGNLLLNANTNVGIENFLFPTANGLTTGLSKDISSEEFLGGLPDMSTAQVNLSENLFSVGRWTKRGSFINFEVNIRSNNDLYLPKDLFRFVKSGTGEVGSFDLSGFAINSTSYAEVAFGTSRHFLHDMLRVGFRAKLLVGIMDAHMTNNYKILTSPVGYTINGKAEVIGATGGIDFATKAPTAEHPETDIVDFTKPQVDKASLTNPSTYTSQLGGAVDLGVEFSPFSWLKVSASVVDLGMIGWKNNFYAKSEDNYTFSGVTINPGSDNMEADIDSQLDAAKKELEKVYTFHKGQSDGASRTTTLPYTAYVGAQFKPLNILSISGLYTHHASEYLPWNEGRAILNVRPLSWLSVSGSYGLNTFGQSIGALVHMRLISSLSVTLGVDGIPLNYTPQYIPISAIQPTANVGINLLLGGRRYAQPKQK